MSDVGCPYCGEDQEINHDDGYGYDEDKCHEQECVSCGKKFKFTIQISCYYEVFCQDGDHDLEQSSRNKYIWRCNNCDCLEIRGLKNDSEA